MCYTCDKKICSVGFPQKQYEIRLAHITRTEFLNLALQGGNRKNFAHCLSWLRLDGDFFAESHSLAGLSGWLHTSLDAAKTWNGENTILLHLSSAKGHETVDEALNLFWFQLMLCRECA